MKLTLGVYRDLQDVAYMGLSKMWSYFGKPNVRRHVILTRDTEEDYKIGHLP